MGYLIELLGIVFPIVLFLFRYILPARFEKALTKKKKEEKQIIIELIHFPSEMLMVAVGYTIPKTIEYLQTLSTNTPQNDIHISLLLNILFSLVLIGVLPFLIAQTKVIENYYYADQRKKVWIQSVIIYILCIISIIISLVLGV